MQRSAKECIGVDLGESFQTHIFLQNLASIQPRTSPVEVCPMDLPNSHAPPLEPGEASFEPAAARAAFPSAAFGAAFPSAALSFAGRAAAARPSAPARLANLIEFGKINILPI